MANQALINPNRALDSNAYAVPGATATFYQTGTTTLITVYSDEDGTVATTNPVVADGNGIFPQTFFNGEAKVVVKDADGATLWTIDPCPSTSGTSTGASNVTFSPTVALPQTNAQAAIEAAAALAISGASDFGLGITGNAPTISNIDATAQASGVYRFTAASTGTFPSGITASTTGLVRIDRQTSAEAIMYLRAAGGARFYVRHLAATTWGAWQGQIDPETLVTSSETIAANDNDTAIPTSAAVIDYVASVSTVKARVNFDGRQIAGTYSRTGTLVTVTQSGHGLSTGHIVTLNFTSGTATDGTYTITVVDANTYTVTDSASGSTSGNLNRDMAIRSSFNVSSVVRNGAGQYTITFTTAMGNADYTVCGIGRGFTNHPIGVVSIDEFTAPTASTLVVGSGNSGGSGAVGQRIDQSHINIVVIA